MPSHPSQFHRFATCKQEDELSEINQCHLAGICRPLDSVLTQWGSISLQEEGGKSPWQSRQARSVCSSSANLHWQRKMSQKHKVCLGVSHIASPPVIVKCFLTPPAGLRPSRPLWSWQRFGEDRPQPTEREGKTKAGERIGEGRWEF